MSDSTSPTPAPAPDPTPAPPKPGYATTEAWFTLLAMIIGAIPASGLVDNAPTAAKIVGLIVAVLAQLGYTTNRTALKRAAAASSAPVRIAVTPLPTALLLFATCSLIASSLPACGAAQRAATGFGACSVASLETDVGDGTLLAALERALATDNYEAEVGKLIAKVGEQEVACAAIAIDDVLSGQGSGSGSAPVPRATPVVRAHVEALIAAKHWR